MLGRAKKVSIERRHHHLTVRGSRPRSRPYHPQSAPRSETTSDYDREKLPGAPCKLAGGVAVMPRRRLYRSRGKGTEDRVDDALHATRAASRGRDPARRWRAHCCGGQGFDGLETATTIQRVGVDLVRRAIEAPVRQIAENAGAEGSYHRRKAAREGGVLLWLEAQTNEYGDLYAMGSSTRPKVVRTALQDAGRSVFSVTTEAMIAKAQEEAAPRFRGRGMDF